MRASCLWYKGQTWPVHVLNIMHVGTVTAPHPGLADHPLHTAHKMTFTKGGETADRIHGELEDLEKVCTFSEIMDMHCKYSGGWYWNVSGIVLKDTPLPLWSPIHHVKLPYRNTCTCNVVRLKPEITCCFWLLLRLCIVSTRSFKSTRDLPPTPPGSLLHTPPMAPSQASHHHSLH